MCGEYERAADQLQVNPNDPAGGEKTEEARFASQFGGLQPELLVRDASESNLTQRCPELAKKATAPDGAKVYAGGCDEERDIVVYVADGEIERGDVLRVGE